MSARFPALVDEQGRLCPHEPKRLSRYRGKHVWASVHEQPAPGLRSNPANAYLWGVVYAAIAYETGADPDTVHEGCKREAVRVGILDPCYRLLGDKLVEDDPTTRTDPDTFQRYVEWVKEGCATGSLTGQIVVIPDAD